MAFEACLQRSNDCYSSSSVFCKYPRSRTSLINVLLKDCSNSRRCLNPVFILRHSVSVTSPSPSDPPLANTPYILISSGRRWRAEWFHPCLDASRSPGNWAPLRPSASNLAGKIASGVPRGKTARPVRRSPISGRYKSLASPETTSRPIPSYQGDETAPGTT